MAATLLGSPLLGEQTILVPILLFVAAAAEPARIVPSDFELKSPPPSLRVTPQDCRRGASAGEIVVCGRNRDQHRVRELKPPRGMEIDEGGIVGFDFGGGRVEPAMEQATMPDGRISKRIMVRWKIAF